MLTSYQQAKQVPFACMCLILSATATRPTHQVQVLKNSMILMPPKELARAKRSDKDDTLVIVQYPGEETCNIDTTQHMQEWRADKFFEITFEEEGGRYTETTIGKSKSDSSSGSSWVHPASLPCWAKAKCCNERYSGAGSAAGKSDGGDGGAGDSGGGGEPEVEPPTCDEINEAACEAPHCCNSPQTCWRKLKSWETPPWNQLQAFLAAFFSDFNTYKISQKAYLAGHPASCQTGLNKQNLDALWKAKFCNRRILTAVLQTKCRSACICGLPGPNTDAKLSDANVSAAQELDAVGLNPEISNEQVSKAIANSLSQTSETADCTNRGKLFHQAIEAHAVHQCSTDDD
mmetsp:Transcript_103509/g.188682  ORF Transcript_103509/g.188682 Transcript_103509/m.188682 type:complete len:346 (-) Transcript_103509:55-1092(-)